VIKYGMACSAELFARLQGDLGPIARRNPESLAPVIADCCRIKASIVETDERESGPRRILNFGHTAGHALEALTRYRRFLHGEAVAYGMLVVGEVAATRKLISATEREALASLIAQLGPLPPIGDLHARPMLEHMHRDKKVEAGTLHMVLPTGIGAAATVADVSDDELLGAMARVGMAEGD